MNEKKSVPTADDLRHSIRAGTRAAFVAQIAAQLISLVQLAMLYHLLQPRDFGVFGLSLLLVTVPRMLVAPVVSAATVQPASLSNGQLASLFWINMLFGAICAIVAAGGGWLVSVYQATPEVNAATLALAATSIVASLGAVHQALLERKMRLATVSRMRVVGQVAGGLAAIAAAWWGAGIWSLVTQQYVELAVLVVGAWRAEPWRPAGPRGCESIRSLLHFGGYYSLSSLAFFIAGNSDKLLLYLLCGSTAAGQAAVGMYNQAYNLMMKPVYLVTLPIAGVMLPALSRAARDHKLYESLTGNFFRLTAIALLPCGVGLYLVASDVMLVLGGDTWQDAGLMLTALAPVVLAQGFINICGSVFASAGRTGRMRGGAVIVAAVLTQGYVAGYWFGHHADPTDPLFPTLGVAWSYSAVALLIVLVPYLAYCFRVVGVSFGGVLKQLLPAARAAVCMGLVVWGVQQMLPSHPSLPAAARLTVLVAAGVVSYGLLAARELRWLWHEVVVARKTDGERRGK